MYLVLASKSPRRKELLLQAGYKLQIRASDVDEEVTETEPKEKVLAIAKKKGVDVFNKVNNNEAVILSADTIVVINGEILGKPKDKDDARRMISLLQGTTHQVYTAVYICGSEGEDSFVEKTDVSIVEMSEEEIERYISTEEPYDKAGGYAIQGMFSQYIETINGDYYNVMGLPVSKVKKALSRYTFTEQLVCNICGNPIKEGQEYCYHCGANIEKTAKKIICPRCHRVNKDSNQFCQFCGSNLKSTGEVIVAQNECRVCHHVNKPEAVYCESCGTILKQTIETINKEKEEFEKKKDYSTVSLVLGIISVSCVVVCCLALCAPILGIISIIFASVSMKRGYKGKSTAGLILGLIGLFLGILINILMFFG